jgi:hypothetical protein
MGMDVYGNNPKSKVGEYFRNNCWYWRPLWDYVCQECKSIITAKDASAGHYNDGHLISATKAVLIANKLDSLLASGEVKAYAQGYKETMDAVPDEPCEICNGTGTRPGGREQFGEAWLKETHGCNGCQGKGSRRPSATWYPFEESNVREFAAFVRESGGFRIS